MASQGPNSAASATDDATVGSIAWSDPSNALVSDGSFATIQTEGISHYLWCLDFGFSIPSDATISGIICSIEKIGGAGVVDNSIRLIVGGAVAGSNRSNVSSWPDPDAYVDHGGISDLWGATLSPADINASDFGIAISAVHPVGINIPGVDHVRMTVYYIGPDEESELLFQTSQPLDLRPMRAVPY